MPHPKFKARHTGNRGRRHKPGEMNKTEAKYADELQLRKLAGEILEWWFEDMTFVLADRCLYTPDFAVWHIDGSLELIDTKGGGPVADDALVKIKLAAEKFHLYQWTMLKQLPKKAGGGWERRVF
jgi:hypothetical protein